MSTETNESSAFSRFMASGKGRVARVGLGVTVIAAGAGAVGGGAGLAIAAFGLVPIAAGVFNLCPIAPIWGGHFVGSRYCSAPQSRSPESRP